MASESCPICGEEADENEIDPHGHFASDDEERCWLCLDTKDEHDGSDHEFELAG
jgi:hypothetical protein